MYAVPSQASDQPTEQPTDQPSQHQMMHSLIISTLQGPTTSATAVLFGDPQGPASQSHNLNFIHIITMICFIGFFVVIVHHFENKYKVKVDEGDDYDDDKCDSMESQRVVLTGTSTHRNPHITWDSSSFS